jgi:hypothetical protein
VPSTLRNSACAHTAPNEPVLAPMIANGSLRSAASVSGREAQSTAFLSCPGIYELYSGVANNTASACPIASRQWVTASAGACSSSSSNGGMSFSRSYLVNCTPGGSSEPAARSSLRL